MRGLRPRPAGHAYHTEKIAGRRRDAVGDPVRADWASGDDAAD